MFGVALSNRESQMLLFLPLWGYTCWQTRICCQGKWVHFSDRPSLSCIPLKGSVRPSCSQIGSNHRSRQGKSGWPEAVATGSPCCLARWDNIWPGSFCQCQGKWQDLRGFLICGVGLGLSMHFGQTFVEYSVRRLLASSASSSSPHKEHVN